jgi:hypothetical protein
VIERPAYSVRVTRPIALFCGWFFLLFAPLDFAAYAFIVIMHAQDIPGLVNILTLVFPILLVLSYVFLTRRRYRFSRYGYYKINGGACDARCYVMRWLLIPAGVILTPLTRSFRQSRLTWVDQITKTELVTIKRDGSRRYAAQAPTSAV